MTAATFWAVFFIVLAVAGGLGAILTVVRSIEVEEDALVWVPFVVVLVIIVALVAAAAAAFIRLAGWS